MLLRRTLNGIVWGALKSTPPRVLGSIPMDQAMAAPHAVALIQSERGTNDRPKATDWARPSNAPSQAPSTIMMG